MTTAAMVSGIDDIGDSTVGLAPARRRVAHQYPEPALRQASGRATVTPVSASATEDAMDWDEARAKPLRALVVGEDLKTLSVAELEARFATLEAEIERTRTEIASKKAHSAAAASLFKSG
jgi:uncharacterized small protein (DUF1192 family)